MNKRKRILLVVIALILLLLAMIVGYTYSKYIGSQDVTGSADTAAWNFSGAISNTDSETTTSITLVPDESKDSIVSGKLAPGTSGSFKIIVNATDSEVDADYDVLLKSEATTKPANLYFTCNDLVNARVDKEDENSELIKYYSLEDLLAVDEETGRSNMSGTVGKNATKIITVNWEWLYESERDGFTQEALDAQDTNDSEIDNYTFTLSIVGKQAE